MQSLQLREKVIHQRLQALIHFLLPLGDTGAYCGGVFLTILKTFCEQQLQYFNFLASGLKFFQVHARIQPLNKIAPDRRYLPSCM